MKRKLVSRASAPIAAWEIELTPDERRDLSAQKAKHEKPNIAMADTFMAIFGFKRVRQPKGSK